MSLENCASWVFDDRARKLLAGLSAHFDDIVEPRQWFAGLMTPEVPLHLNYLVIPWNWKFPLPFLLVSDCTPPPLPLCCSGTCAPVWADSTHYTCRKLTWGEKVRIFCAVSRSRALSEGLVNVETCIKEGAGLRDGKRWWKRAGCGTDLLAALRC